MPGQQQRNLAGGLPVPARRQQAAEPVLDGGQPFLRQPGPDRLDPHGPGHVGQRRAPPQCQRLAERVDRTIVVPRFPGRGHQRPEQVHIHPVRDGAQPVAVPVPVERAARRPGQGLAEPDDQDLQAGASRPGRPVLPQNVDQVIDRHHLPGRQRQARQQQAQLRPLRPKPGTAIPHLHRPEHPQPQLAFQLASPATAAHRATEARW